MNRKLKTCLPLRATLQTDKYTKSTQRYFVSQLAVSRLKFWYFRNFSRKILESEAIKQTLKYFLCPFTSMLAQVGDQCHQTLKNEYFTQG